MMYIEHSNLEDNLHHILTNRVPTSSSPSASEATAAVAVSALLARAREALNSASSTLQEHTVETISTNNQLQNHSNNSSGAPNNYKKAIIKKDLIRRPEPKLLPLENGNSIDFTNGLRRAPPTVENNIISASAKLQNHQYSVDEEEEEVEEKDEEQYELLQLIDSNLTTQAENLKKNLKVEKTPKQKEIYNCAPISRFEADLKDGQTIFSSITAASAAALSHSQVDEDEEFEYVVTRVPKIKIQPAGSQEFQVVNSILNRTLYKPVPEAIPIETHSRVIRQPPPLAKLRRLIPNQEHNNNNKHRKLNGYATVSAFYAEDDNNCGYYSDTETVEAASTDQSAYGFNKDFLSRQETQMGLDILSKLKHLFNWNPSTNDYNSIAHQEGNRKRRSNDWSVGESVGPQQIKYRKVENRFPKYIAACSEDDEVNEYLPPFTHHNQQRKAQKYDKQYLVNNSAQSSSRTLLEMSNRRTTSIDKPPLRKSIFSAPHITQQLFKNTTYADVEFSDDDEPYLRKGFNIQPSKLTSAKRVPEAFNIPIIRTGERLKPIQQKPPPPPLIEPSTGSILQSSLIPCLETRRKPTYAETLRQSAETGHVLGGRSSNSSSGVPTSESSRIFNGLLLRTNHWPTQNRSSILNQEKASEEREKYQQLLEQVVPRLYGSTGVENKLASACSSNSASQRRRSALILGAALTSSARSSPTLDIRSKCFGQSTLKRPPLSSTINLDEDIEYDDVTITGVSHLKTLRTSKIKQPLSGTVIIDDDELSDIIDLGNEERHVLSTCAKIQKEKNSIINLCEDKNNKPKREALPFVEPVNSLQERFNASPHIKDNWLQNWQLKWLQRKKNRRDEVKETVKVTEKLTAERRAAEAEIQERLRKFQIVDPELLIIDDFEDAIEEPEFVELTEEYRARINAALCGPLDQVLISKFNLNITRRDIHTLCGHNWLNDEVINFYMNLLTHRGERKHDSHGLPRVYAMNTFFVPRLMQAGHDGVKRWTRKVDIFGKDIVPVPVHVGGVHWCMAIIHMKNRTIKYYDSMGTPNPNVLKALAQYLKDESMDKRKQPFDTSDFVVESVHGVPRQMNGSDCGVFSCMFAEYITRNRDITFSQQNMEYFRQKMVLEIVTGELLQ